MQVNREGQNLTP